MKFIIFAGGSGTRFWPLSRKSKPKQFLKLFNGLSTLEIQANNLAKNFGWENIFIQTQIEFKDIIFEYLPKLPIKNLIIEPAKKDVGPAVGYAMMEMLKLGFEKEMIGIIWGDTIIDNQPTYISAINISDKLIKDNPNQMILFGENPRFVSELGWIELGEKLDNFGNLSVYDRKSFSYKPERSVAEVWYRQKTHVWNIGYFFSTVEFILQKYKEYDEELYKKLKASSNDPELYKDINPISFDKIVPERLAPNESVVITANYGWADPGTLQSFKEYMQLDSEDIVKFGNVKDVESVDCLVWNTEDNKLVATIGLESIVIVNTPDVVLVCPKHRVRDISKYLENLKETNPELL